MALFDVTKPEIQVGMEIKNILKILMGDDYITQLAKRALLFKDDALIHSIRRIEKLLRIEILDSNSIERTG